MVWDLIETYWDVKKDITLYITDGTFDLIETYWDVKIFDLDKFNLAQGFNRNILGCKGSRGAGVFNERYRFNRNILGCKDVEKNVFIGKCIWYNRNILGCKDTLNTGCPNNRVFDLIETYWDVKTW